MAEECNIEKSKKCRDEYFERIIYNAKLKELRVYKQDLDKEIRLGETAKREGYPN